MIILAYCFKSLDKVKFSDRYNLDFKFLSLMCVSTWSLVILSFSSPYSQCSAKLRSLVAKFFILSPDAGAAPRKFCHAFGGMFLASSFEIIIERLHRLLVVFSVALRFLGDGRENFSDAGPVLLGVKEGLVAVSGRRCLML